MEVLLMATEKQINANRKNAQKSTGPKTAEGKAAVSQNAVKHGLFTRPFSMPSILRFLTEQPMMILTLAAGKNRLMNIGTALSHDR
jgi:hypothetical protein